MMQWRVFVFSLTEFLFRIETDSQVSFFVWLLTFFNFYTCLKVMKTNHFQWSVSLRSERLIDLHWCFSWELSYPDKCSDRNNIRYKGKPTCNSCLIIADHSSSVLIWHVREKKIINHHWDYNIALTRGLESTLLLLMFGRSFTDIKSILILWVWLSCCRFQML